MEAHTGGAKWFDEGPSTSSTTAALSDSGTGGDSGSSVCESLGLLSPITMDWNQQQPLLNQDKNKLLQQDRNVQVTGFTSNLQLHSMESSTVTSCLGLISSASGSQPNSIDYHQNTYNRRYDNYFGLMPSNSQNQLQQLQLTNNTLCRDVSQTQMAMSTFEDKPMQNVLEYLRDISSTEKNSSIDTKRTKNEGATSTSTHLKVRKERMGDKITTLQQLVSPFGKTDTASVLSEAIDYIKFLHQQINGNEKIKMEPNDEQRHDLRSRGLCLVPVSATFPIAQDTTTDFWMPIIGGTAFN